MSVTIDNPGIYTIPLVEYIADPCPEPSLSASIAHTIVMESPLHAFIQHPRLNIGAIEHGSNKMDIGTIVHGMVLEGDESRLVIVEPDLTLPPDQRLLRLPLSGRKRSPEFTVPNG